MRQSSAGECPNPIPARVLPKYVYPLWERSPQKRHSNVCVGRLFRWPEKGLITSGSKLSVNIPTIALLLLLLKLSCKKKFATWVKMSGTSIYVAPCKQFLLHKNKTLNG